MIIFIVAFNELLLSVIQSEIDILKKFPNENNYSFVEAAIWANDNKEIQFNQFTQWYYSKSSVVDPDFSGDIPVENMNVTWAINEMTKTLSNSNLPSMDSGLAISFSNQFPDGDEGMQLIWDTLRPIVSLHYKSALALGCMCWPVWVHLRPPKRAWVGHHRWYCSEHHFHLPSWEGSGKAGHHWRQHVGWWKLSPRKRYRLRQHSARRYCVLGMHSARTGCREWATGSCWLQTCW